VSAQSLGSGVLPRPGSGVDGSGLDDATRHTESACHSPSPAFLLDAHVTILQELSDTRSGVGVGDLGGLLGVQPDWGRRDV
jgi:hypothetical protein